MWQDKVRNLRKELGLTQVQFGALIGCTGTHVNDLEHGKRGKRLGYETGRAIDDLYQRTFGDRAPDEVADTSGEE